MPCGMAFAISQQSSKAVVCEAKSIGTGLMTLGQVPRHQQASYIFEDEQPRSVSSKFRPRCSLLLQPPDNFPD